jgi:ribosomal protein S21
MQDSYPLQVIVKGEDIEAALRKLRKQIVKDGTLQQIKWRFNGNPKPSVKRRAKALRSLKRNARSQHRREKRAYES